MRCQEDLPGIDVNDVHRIVDALSPVPTSKTWKKFGICINVLILIELGYVERQMMDSIYIFNEPAFIFFLISKKDQESDVV